MSREAVKVKNSGYGDEGKKPVKSGRIIRLEEKNSKRKRGKLNDDEKKI